MLATKPTQFIIWRWRKCWYWTK